MSDGSVLWLMSAALVAIAFCVGWICGQMKWKCNCEERVKRLEETTDRVYPAGK